jgi:hypothetical protein
VEDPRIWASVPLPPGPAAAGRLPRSHVWSWCLRQRVVHVAVVGHLVAEVTGISPQAIADRRFVPTIWLLAFTRGAGRTFCRRPLLVIAGHVVIKVGSHGI